MKPIHHPLCNDILRPPQGMTEDQCRYLRIRREPGRVISFWRPAPAELAVLNSGQPIILSFMGQTHPPLMMEVLAPDPDAQATASKEDYEKTYDDFWKDIVQPDGKFDMDVVKRELHDYWAFMQSVAEVYCHITGNRISKPNTPASVVIDEAEAYYQRLQEEERLLADSSDPANPPDSQNPGGPGE